MPDKYKPTKGSTLLIPSGTPQNPGGKHLFFVVTNRCPANFHLLFSMSTIKPQRAYDTTCVIKAGEHPFAEADSFIFYAKPQQLGSEGIEKCVVGGTYIPKDDCDPEVLKRICEGISASPFTSRWAKEYFRINGQR